MPRPNQITIELHPDIRQRLDDLAKRKYKARADLIRESIMQMLESEDLAESMKALDAGKGRRR